jgi:hypothetical protein
LISSYQRGSNTTKNLVVENGILSADSLVKAASAESVIEYNKAKVYVAHNTADMLHSQSEYYAGKLNEIAASTDKLYAERDKLVAQLAEIDTNVVQKKFDMYMRSREFENADKLKLDLGIFEKPFQAEKFRKRLAENNMHLTFLLTLKEEVNYEQKTDL